MTHTLANFGKQVFFAGTCGCYYPFTVYPINAKFPDKNAVYIFIREHNGCYDALYIGETDTLSRDFFPYDKWVCASRWFMNGICIYFEDDAASRLKIARDLIQRQKPVCNEPQK